MLKKAFMAALILAAAQVEAATWDRMMKKGNVTFYQESGSGGIAREHDDTIRAHYRLDYDQPQKTTTGKYYTRETVWFSADCSRQEFLANSSVFLINGNQQVGTNNGRNRSWTKYNRNSNGAYHLLWREMCLQ